MLIALQVLSIILAYMAIGTIVVAAYGCFLAKTALDMDDPEVVVAIGLMTIFWPITFVVMSAWAGLRASAYVVACLMGICYRAKSKFK